MRTALSDAPIASDSGTSTVAPTEIARIGSGQSTMALRIAETAAIASATVTPQASHWKRGRTVSGARCARAMNADTPSSPSTTTTPTSTPAGSAGRSP